MLITTIKDLRQHIAQRSGFSPSTVNAAIKAMGFPQQGSGEIIKELSSLLESCAEYGAHIGIPGFTYYRETIRFFQKNQQGIINHMEQTAAEFGVDVIAMVQGFGVFRHSAKPKASHINKALYSRYYNPNLDILYNAFAWYALEEISRTWYRYVEEYTAFSVVIV